jgi:hypothetical protein
MSTIDIALPASLQDKLSQPICIPLPKPGKLQLTLPTGGRLQALVDVTKAIPDDCSLSFSLALQLGPILANLDCLMKIVKVIAPLLDVVTGLASVPPKVQKVAEALPKLIEAAPPLIDCIAQFTGLGIFQFVRDILNLLAKMLRCVCQQMRSILNLMSGLSLQIAAAKSLGNTELLSALECAQQNAETSMGHAMTGIEPVFVLLELVGPLLGMVGAPEIKTPTLAPAEDLQTLLTTIETLEELAKLLQTVADSLGAE